MWARLIGDLTGRLTGPLTMRLFLQPAMAAYFAIRDGIADARQGRPPYFWCLFTVPKTERRRLLREGWKAVMKVFVMAIALDVVYQWIVFRWVYPGEAVIVAFVLAVVPYTLIRGPANRIARNWIRPETGVRS
jgi:hypothetical protein